MDELVGASNSVTQLSNFIFRYVTLYSHSSHNYVTSLQKTKVVGVTYALSMSCPIIFDYLFENRERKVSQKISKFKMFKCSLIFCFNYCR